MRRHLHRLPCVRVRGTPGREGGLEGANGDVERLRRAVDVQDGDGVFGVRREERREPALADLEVRIVISVRPHRADAWKHDAVSASRHHISVDRSRSILSHQFDPDPATPLLTLQKLRIRADDARQQISHGLAGIAPDAGVW
jgi:hypothetical protein